MNAELISVLLVEDDRADALLVEELIADANADMHVVWAQSMADAERSLATARPDCVLLDLNLPRRNGLEVLAEMKADSDLLNIPVVVLTTSQADEDILRSYSLHANAYISKPVDFERFIEVIRQIDNFFLTLVKLPPSLN